MSEHRGLERLETWASRVVEDSARLPEDLSESELRERQVAWYADFFTLDDADPDDPALRDRLVDEEGMDTELADEVLAKLRERRGSAY
jgi:hypothetical protein